MGKKIKKKETLNLRSIALVALNSARLNLTTIEKINRNLNTLLGSMSEMIAMKAQLNRMELLINSIVQNSTQRKRAKR